ncbi:MAG: alanine--tRNA ligase [Anaeromicrobium sp.]|jgi:alanyl-tRNA synthetase|uniref:alanine--tRNA ligase n=1 Tax=Anaeromicrobium sp. TaxID=1929132 RepID=UPI0025F89F2B|nr:alanine--tRNA ligase [Anaeromicrobium sp.]MCT4595042.1 alanine--tRNA ligase [Anaeromicrobium sp.]
MEKMGLNEIRKKFLDFFESKDHYARESYSLVPQGDKSLLLISAGMAPLKKYFMGVETPPKNRMATCQKCIRTGDIENVGKTARHATFFEMLGNFSFGDYFKRESIGWGWEFVTKHLNMPVEKLWVSVYLDDDESYEIWSEEIGVSKDRIVRLGKEDNFWEIGVGPCGPCSEIYYDRGEKYGCGCVDCKPGCDCDRYVEFWNHVFTQYNKDEAGTYNPLPNPNIDTGMGLERVACIMQDVDSIFEVDTIRAILDAVLDISKAEYGRDEKTDTSIRIITDHIRSVSFMVCDGIMPSNEGRGYVLRRLLRRAARHGKLLGIKGAFLNDLVDKVIEVSKVAYGQLEERQDYIKKVISIEEERFQETIDQGSEILKEYIEDLRKEKNKVLSGEKAFKLYDTYGFPLELTKEILEEEGLEVDEEKFKEEMELQRQRARSARTDDSLEAWKEDVFSKIDDSMKTEFVGYDNYEVEVQLLNIVKDNELVDKAQASDKVTLILDKTPFYPEGGGQLGDKGIIETDSCKIEIYDCKKGNNELILHVGEIKEGSVSKNDKVMAKIHMNNRLNSARNHSATHLIHKALKEVLGSHVEQSGSLVSADRLRFDFSHFTSLTKDEVETVERIVNERILDGLKVETEEMSISEAREKGATALFGEKYGEKVRVVSMDKYSIELCGGTHVSNVGQIGLFKIVSEGGVAAGIRRIEAITGFGAYEYTRDKEIQLNEIAKITKSNPKDVNKKVEQLVNELKSYEKEINDLKNKLASSSLDDIINSVEVIEGINVISNKIMGLDMNALRTIGDKLKDKLGSGLVVLATENEGKVSFVAMATKDAVDKGIHAGNVIKTIAKIAGGGGGGRPNMAQAGAKDPSKIREALDKVKEVVKEQIK